MLKANNKVERGGKLQSLVLATTVFNLALGVSIGVLIVETAWPFVIIGALSGFASYRLTTRLWKEVA